MRGLQLWQQTHCANIIVLICLLYLLFKPTLFVDLVFISTLFLLLLIISLECKGYAGNFIVIPGPMIVIFLKGIYAEILGNNYEFITGEFCQPKRCPFVVVVLFFFFLIVIIFHKSLPFFAFVLYPIFVFFFTIKTLNK